jgi:transposase
MKMKQKSQTRQTGAAKAIKDIRRATRKQYSAEEKIRIVLDGLRGEEIVRHHIKWNTWRPDLREDLAHLVQDIKRRIPGIASAGFPSFCV